MTVGLSKLVTNVCRDARFDASRTDRNQHKTRKHPVHGHALVAHHRQGGMAETVDHGECEDGPVFADQNVGKERAKNREKIDRRCK